MAENDQHSALTIGQKLSLLGVYSFLSVLSLFPLSWMRVFGSAVGGLYYKLADKRVHIVRINLGICYPTLNNEERELLVKKTFQAAGIWFFEAGAIWLWPTEKLRGLLEFENEEVFDRALENDNGIMLAIPHIGNWEMLGPYISSRSEFACFYQHKNQNPVFNEFVRRRRMRDGTVMAPANRTGIRQLYKHLRAGKVAGLLPDHFPADDMGVFAPFFDRPALTGTLISSLARKNNVPVIASAVIRTKKGFKIHFVEVKDQDSDNELLAATSLNRAVENCINLAPPQFQWVYPRFRRRVNPESEPDPYRSTYH